MARIRIGIAGAGRMGQAIAAALQSSGDAELVGIWQRGEPLSKIVADADVLIDFSLPEAHAEVVSSVAEHGKALVCGVSGLSDEQFAAMQTLSAQVPVVFDRNMSQGVAVLQTIVERAAAALGSEYSVEIHETHHVHKLDSPSGTALKLAEAIAAGKRVDPASLDINFKVERRGEVPGDHSVVWFSASESITLSHSVTTRDVFAAGAIRAAFWVRQKSPGLYSMHDVLFSAA